MKKILISVLKILGLYKVPATPGHIKRNFKTADKGEISSLRPLLKKIYGGMPGDGADLEADLLERLDKFRSRHIPFLDSLIGLEGKKILEIGSGTGSSSIALAEQGAQVSGIDVDEPSLAVAREQARIYGLQNQINSQLCNAGEADSFFGEGVFDLVIFFASIEHMTNPERIAALKAAWKVLKKGGALSILGTPNRLWFYDSHTAYLPFYMWLPDDIAFQYTRFSPREHFNRFFESPFEDLAKTNFSRWGRGVSYHELEIAIKPMHQLKVLGDLHSFERPDTFLQGLSYRRSDDYKYKQFLAKHGPRDMPMGFYEYYLDVVIQKQD